MNRALRLPFRLLLRPEGAARLRPLACAVGLATLGLWGRVACAASVVALPPCGGSQTVTVNLSTGQATAGSVDPYWEAVAVTGNAGVTAMNPAPVIRINALNPWVAPSAGSGWVTHSQGAFGWPSPMAGLGAELRLRFTVPSTLGGCTLTGSVAADNGVVLKLNGTQIASTTAFSAATPVSANAGTLVVAGTNELRAVVSNQDQTWLGFLATLTLTRTCPPPPCATPPTGIVAWYRFEEPLGAAALQDFAGAANAASVLPSPPSSGPVAGKVALARSFVGSYGQAPDHAELDFGAGAFTIDAWVRPVNTNKPGMTHAVVDKYDVTAGASARGYALGLEGNRPALLRNGVTYVMPGAGVAFGVWSFVAVVVSPHANPATGTVRFYVNGAAAPPLAGVPSASVSTPGVPLWIGKSRAPNAGIEIGIDELELFSRALTAAEVGAIYAAGSSGKCKGPPSPHGPIDPR